ncbi:unnamed protein product [Effrenium voratum]|nr:unnamed protein product [Effrenium voratum]
MGAVEATSCQSKGGAKWDVLAADADPEKRKNLCRALRHFALVHGAHLVLTSLKEKTSMNAMRSVLRQMLFGVAPKGGLPEQLDHSKPICVAAGKDSVAGIGLPASGQASDRAWREYVQHLFPDPSRRTQPETFQVLVRCLSGKVLCRVAASADEPVEAVKDRVAAASGICSAEQRLLWGGRELQSLKDAPAHQELQLTLLRRPKEQAEWLQRVAQAESLSKAPELIREDREVLMAAVKVDDDALQWASPNLLADQSVVLEAVRRCGFALACACTSLQADREVVLAAVARHGLALESACESLRADVEVVLTAVEQDGNAFQFAALQLRGDRDFVLRAVQQNGYALTYAMPELRGDREIVAAAIERTGWIWECGARVAQFGGWALQCAAQELQADRDLVLSAVHRDGAALSFAGRLQEDREVVLAAVQQSGEALAFASQELRADREVVLAAIDESAMALEHASDELRDDEALVLRAVANGPALRFASPRLRGSRAVLRRALPREEEALRWASEELRADRRLQKVARRCGQVQEELYKYPESSIDGMVEQRVEELQQYRRQVERNQRLASEGIEGNKVLTVAA